MNKSIKILRTSLKLIWVLSNDVD